jgi:hypothetical protein
MSFIALYFALFDHKLLIGFLLELSGEEGRKRVIGITAAILAARKRR